MVVKACLYIVNNAQFLKKPDILKSSCNTGFIDLNRL